jgi:hypothetical protein
MTPPLEPGDSDLVNNVAFLTMKIHASMDEFKSQHHPPLWQKSPKMLLATTNVCLLDD